MQFSTYYFRPSTWNQSIIVTIFQNKVSIILPRRLCPLNATHITTGSASPLYAWLIQTSQTPFGRWLIHSFPVWITIIIIIITYYRCTLRVLLTMTKRAVLVLVTSYHTTFIIKLVIGSWNCLILRVLITALITCRITVNNRVAISSEGSCYTVIDTYNTIMSAVCFLSSSSSTLNTILASLEDEWYCSVSRYCALLYCYRGYCKMRCVNRIVALRCLVPIDWIPWLDWLNLVLCCLRWQSVETKGSMACLLDPAYPTYSTSLPSSTHGTVPDMQAVPCC